MGTALEEESPSREDVLRRMSSTAVSAGVVAQGLHGGEDLQGIGIAGQDPRSVETPGRMPAGVAIQHLSREGIAISDELRRGS